MGRKKKKVVLIIVEGPSEQTALERYFVRIFNNEQIVTRIIHGDVTTQSGLNRSNIKAHLGNMVRAWMKKDMFKKSDIARIIHIVDMDGAYIDDEFVIEDKSIEKTTYLADTIHTLHVENIKRRNQQKREILNALSTNSQDRGLCNGIPYNIYYMSCNLEHVLHDVLNVTDEEKEKMAFDFAEKYIDEPSQFIDFMCESIFSICDDYDTSWSFIKEDKHSLERYSNLGLCFK